jgi:hypothetical protein
MADDIGMVDSLWGGQPAAMPGWTHRPTFPQVFQCGTHEVHRHRFHWENSINFAQCLSKSMPNARPAIIVLAYVEGRVTTSS